MRRFNPFPYNLLIALADDYLFPQLLSTFFVGANCPSGIFPPGLCTAARLPPTFPCLPYHLKMTLLLSSLSSSCAGRMCSSFSWESSMASMSSAISCSAATTGWGEASAGLSSACCGGMSGGISKVLDLMRRQLEQHSMVSPHTVSFPKGGRLWLCIWFCLYSVYSLLIGPEFTPNIWNYLDLLRQGTSAT